MSYIDNEILERLIGTMVEGFARIEKKLDQMNRLKECMNGDKLLDNVDLAELLGVSQRTLARYRQEGKIKYYSTSDMCQCGVNEQILFFQGFRQRTAWS